MATPHKMSTHKMSMHNSYLPRCDDCVICSGKQPEAHGIGQHEDDMPHSDKCGRCIHRQRKSDPDWWCNSDPSRPCVQCRINVSEYCRSRICIICKCHTEHTGDFLYLFHPRLKYNENYCYSTCTVQICEHCNARCVRFTADKPDEIPAGWDAWDIYDEIEHALSSQRPAVQQFEYKTDEFPPLSC